jgi:Uma2 family endonuclease
MTTRAKPVTYDDYLTLPNDGKKYEIIDGELVMTPSPISVHQRISRNLVRILDADISEKKLGEVFYAPLDVVLSMTDVVQPDILFVSRDRSEIITKKNIIAAPDLVIEILSESTETLDRVTKKDLYERYGAKEYWIVDPSARTVVQYVLENKTYRSVGTFKEDDVVEVKTIGGLSVKLSEVFAE